MITLLVTGVGAIIGYGIIKSLRQTDEQFRIIGMDIYEDAYGQFLCDKFYVAQRADSENYVNFVNHIVQRDKIDLIIPGIEQDMYRLYKEKDNITTKIVLNNSLLINLSQDKLETYKYFRSTSNLDLIQTLHLKDYDYCKLKLGNPFLLKPRSSYASKGIHKISTKEEFDFYNSQPDKNICQKLIDNNSHEYTVSVFGDGYGNYYDYIILKRKLAQTGATDKAIVIQKDERIMAYVNQICALTNPDGPTNIQLRTENDKIYLLEINPRISSACSIRTLAGYNEPLMCVYKYLGEIEAFNPKPKRPIKAVRFIDDFIYE